jgi:hypothetical protein
MADPSTGGASGQHILERHVGAQTDRQVLFGFLDFCTRRVIRFGCQVRLLSLSCLSADEPVQPQLTQAV